MKNLYISLIVFVFVIFSTSSWAQILITCELISEKENQVVFDVYLQSEKDQKYLLANMDFVLETNAEMVSFKKVEKESQSGIQTGFCTFTPIQSENQWQNRMVAQNYYQRTSTSIINNLAIINVSAPPVVNEQAYQTIPALVDNETHEHRLGRFAIELNSKESVELDLKIQGSGLRTKLLHILEQANYPHVMIDELRTQTVDIKDEVPSKWSEIQFDVQNEEEVFTIYPNPASDYLVINFKESANQVIQLVSGNGIVLIQTLVDDSQKRLDMTHLAPGVYTIRLQTDTFVETKQFIKI